MKLGVVGYSVPSGIGHICQGIAKKLKATLWLSPRHTLHGHGPLAPDGCALHQWDNFDESAVELFRTHFEGLTTLVAVEDGWHKQMFRVAHDMDVRTVLVVMPEWFNPAKSWVPDVDAFVVHTRQALECMVNYGLGKRTFYVPLPICLNDFPARIRTRAERFVFSEGHTNERKGIACVDEANESLGGIIKKWNQDRNQVPYARELWEDADVAVQPSHWEGVGLCLLEAMAVGCMVVTSDAPPMSDYIAAAYGTLASNALVPCRMTTRQLGAPFPWPESVPDGRALADILRSIRHTDIGKYSARGIAYIEQKHGNRQWEILRQVLAG